MSECDVPLCCGCYGLIQDLLVSAFLRFVTEETVMTNENVEFSA